MDIEGIKEIAKEWDERKAEDVFRNAIQQQTGLFSAFLPDISSILLEDVTRLVSYRGYKVKDVLSVSRAEMDYGHKTALCLKVSGVKDKDALFSLYLFHVFKRIIGEYRDLFDENDETLQKIYRARSIKSVRKHIRKTGVSWINKKWKK